MKKILYIILGILIAGATTVYAQTVFKSSQLGTSPVSGYILQTNGTSSVWVPNTGGGTSGITATSSVSQTSHGFSAGQWVGQTGSTTIPYALTNAVPGGVYQAVGIVDSVTDANNFVLRTSGDYADTSLIPGMTYYLSASTTALGTVVGYPPTTAGYVSAPVGFAKSGTLATIQIGRPSEVALSASISGINVGNDMIGSTYYSTSSVVADAAVIQKNLASNRVRIALPSYNNPIGVYNMRELAKYYKSLGYYVSYGVTGRTGGQNLTTFNAWVAQVPTEAAWADANNIDMFYIGNEEDNDAQLGQMGTVTWNQVSAAVLTLSTSVKVAYPDMRVVYSTAQGQVIRWHDYAYPSFGALDGLGFNMYDTLASFEPNIEYFITQIGSKYFVTEWASNYPYYDMINSHGYTDAEYAADLASRAGTLKKFGLEAYFFTLRYGGNTPISGNWNIYTNTNTFLPGAVSAFGGASGNQVLTTPIILGDNQAFYMNDAKTGFIYCDITNCNFVAPEFGTLVLKARTLVESTASLTFRIRYNSSQYESTAVSSTGTITRDAVGTSPKFVFSDNVGIATSTPVYPLTAFSSTAPQLSLSAGTGVAQWTMRNAGGNLYFATTTVAGTATTTSTAFSIIGSTGEVITRALTVLTKFVGVIAAAFTPSTEGELGIDTTSNQFKYFSGGAVRVVSPTLYPAFTYATSTAWTATTTIPLGSAFVAETWTGVQCFTDAGTVNVSFYDGTNRMNMFNASTTVGTVTLSTNNSFTASEKRYVDIGTPASSPTKVSCTLSKTIDAN